MGGSIGGIVGGALGTAVGGPVGGAIGGSIGSAVGGGLDGGGEQQGGGGGGGAFDPTALIEGSAEASRLSTLFGQRGIGALNVGFGAGQGFLSGGLASAQGQLAPTSLAGFQALDQISDLLGLSRPIGGSFNLANEKQRLGQVLSATERDLAINRERVRSPEFREGIISLEEARDRVNQGTERVRAIQGVINSPTKIVQAAALSAEGKPLGEVSFSAGNLDAALNQANPSFLGEGISPEIALTDPKDLQQAAVEGLFETPGFQFQLEQGVGALEKGAAARGKLFSSEQAQNLQQFGQGLATTTFNQRLSQLSGLAGLGQAATSQSAALGAGIAGQQSGLASSLGQLQAQQFGDIGTAQANNALLRGQALSQTSLGNQAFGGQQQGGGGGFNIGGALSAAGGFLTGQGLPTQTPPIFGNQQQGPTPLGTLGGFLGGFF